MDFSPIHKLAKTPALLFQFALASQGSSAASDPNCPPAHQQNMGWCTLPLKTTGLLAGKGCRAPAHVWCERIYVLAVKGRGPKGYSCFGRGSALILGASLFGWRFPSGSLSRSASFWGLDQSKLSPKAKLLNANRPENGWVFPYHDSFGPQKLNLPKIRILLFTSCYFRVLFKGRESSRTPQSGSMLVDR